MPQSTAMRATLKSDTGEGPALVYIPGVDGTGELLIDTAAALEREWRLLRLAYAPEGEDRYPALAASIESVLAERLGTAERGGCCVVLAESFGGAVALTLALQAPERVRALMIVNSFCYYRRRLRLGLTRCFAPLAQGPVFHLGRRIFGARTLLGRQASAEDMRSFLSVRGTECDAAYRRRLAMLARVDLRARLGEIHCPVQLIASTADRVVDSLPSAQVLLEGLPNATLRELPGAGHIVLPRAYPWAEWLRELARR
jgi:pimeloyl-ACP methyl ester carboxylesterase